MESENGITDFVQGDMNSYKDLNRLMLFKMSYGEFK